MIKREKRIRRPKQTDVAELNFNRWYFNDGTFEFFGDPSPNLLRLLLYNSVH